MRALGRAIIVVTAKGEEVDRVVGLELGADDYIVKPFGFRELLARIRAVMRRARPAPTAHRSTSAHSRSTFGAASDHGRRPAEPDDEGVRPARAARIEPGDVVSRQRILREVWDTEWFGPTKTVDVHVASLRKKLGDPGWIETVRGIGLRLVARP